MRPGEKEGEKYRFISKTAFEDMIQKGEMLEYAEYCGNFYGTPKGPIIDWLKAGKSVIVEVDVQGAKKIYDAMPQAVKIFVMPPSMEVLKQRLLGRKTESEAAARKRLEAAVKEISQAREYHYILTNDKLEYAVLLLESVLTAEAIKTNQMQNLIDEVLQDAQSIHW